MAIPASFSKAIRSRLLPFNHLIKLCTRNYGIWEPDYLILAKTKTPEYDLINVQMKGYDFAVLESYQSLVHKIANNMNLDVEDTWASPHQDLKVQKFIPNSSNVEKEYILKLYERNVQIADPKCHIMALFIEAIITICPPGVNLSIHEHTPETEENRYVPDYEVIELRQQLSEIGKVKIKKRKGF